MIEGEVSIRKLAVENQPGRIQVPAFIMIQAPVVDEVDTRRGKQQAANQERTHPERTGGVNLKSAGGGHLGQR